MHDGTCICDMDTAQRPRSFGAHVYSNTYSGLLMSRLTVALGQRGGGGQFGRPCYICNTKVWISRLSLRKGGLIQNSRYCWQNYYYSGMKEKS